jgi:hypothetical protein
MHINTIFGLTLPLILAFINVTGGTRDPTSDPVQPGWQSGVHNPRLEFGTNSIQKRYDKDPEEYRSFTFQATDEDSGTSSESESDIGNKFERKLRKRSIFRTSQGHKRKADRNWEAAQRNFRNGKKKKAGRFLARHHRELSKAAKKGDLSPLSPLSK